MKRSSLFILVLLSFCGTLACTGQEVMENQSEKQHYFRHIGDSEYIDELDDPDFELCYGDEEVYQYFNNSEGLEYEGEKIAIIEQFKKEYNTEQVKKESGLIRIRFIVNCKGETDRFRLIGRDSYYEDKVFDSSITTQILSITKSLKGWKSKILDGNSIDYYQYLIFKLKDGQIIEILP